MIRTICALIVAGFVVVSPGNGQTVSLGGSRQDVILEFGEPIGTVRSGSEEVLSYRGIEVQLQNGRVTKLVRLNNSPLGAKPSAPATVTTSVRKPVQAPAVAPASPPATVSFQTQAVTTNQVAVAPWMQKSHGIFSPNAPRTPARVAGIGLALLGMLVASGAGVWLIVRAFGVGVGWGLACLFLPFAPLVFICMHWEDGGKPFLISLAGSAGMVTGFVVACM
jgi:hypothetical protein